MTFVLHDDAECQTLKEIFNWYVEVRDLIFRERLRIWQCLVNGQPVEPRFVGMVESELDKWHDDMRKELSRLTILNLVGSVEASIRIDFHRRVKGRFKDRLSLAYRKWFKGLSKTKKERPDFNERGILDQLKKSDAIDKYLINNFRDCLKVRHWIGHGRYWQPPTMLDSFEPLDVHNHGDALVVAVESSS